MDNIVINITEITDSVQINVNEAITQVFTDGVTVTGNGTISNPLVAVAGSGDMLRSTYDPTNKNADAFSMENMVEGATNKILTSAERAKLNNLSGTNTGDQDLTPYLTSATAAATYQPIGAYLTTISGLNISQLTNDSGYITSAALSPYLTATVAAATYQPIGSYLTSISGLNISQLTNDSGYITSAALSGLVPETRTITINGTTYDLSADRSFTVTGGVSAMGAIGSTPNANGATITGTTLVLQPADASFGGIITTSAQTIAGLKTFTSHIYSSQSAGIGFRAGKAPTNNDSNIWLGGNAISPTDQNSVVSVGNGYTIINAAQSGSRMYFTINNVPSMNMNSVGLFIGTGTTAATAKLHLAAGTAAANTAPIKLTAGTNMATPENGAFEFDGTNLYFTVGGVRKTVTLV
jgi:hypothetical protein